MLSCIMITKELLRDYALQYKKDHNKFPTLNHWLVKDGFPCSGPTLKKLFNNSYNEFRDYCQEAHSKRTTVGWIKNNCVINDKGCWEWLKGTMPSGYGKTSINGVEYPVHKAILLLLGINIPNGTLVRHKCHNKVCCNPDHLELGSYSQNTIDSREYSKASKLTTAQVILVKKDIEKHSFNTHGSKVEFDKKWASLLNVSYSLISQIRLGRTWKDITI